MTTTIPQLRYRLMTAQRALVDATKALGTEEPCDAERLSAWEDAVSNVSCAEIELAEAVSQSARGRELVEYEQRIAGLEMRLTELERAVRDGLLHTQANGVPATVVELAQATIASDLSMYLDETD